ncbi:hypothetical protein L202_06799 [Cryptococcus amylolentus CBS 6039]|uniref:Uncharacterized protein n=1 Tax=Cryptococcus amylolentus CBS 6039 TaxID=1295533 RepID=A0A1E3HDG6_9TREE|nr:hypothetical protein L202_06799 [Cryptococcus amylolentus CBS 6039]ODN74393.1 hypothetical protein L202_06799 [Cryptococcus amylolentus CBS 6039]
MGPLVHIPKLLAPLVPIPKDKTPSPHLHHHQTRRPPRTSCPFKKPDWLLGHAVLMSLGRNDLRWHTSKAECFVLQPVPKHMKYRKRKRLALGMEIAPRPRVSSRAPSGSKLFIARAYLCPGLQFRRREVDRSGNRAILVLIVAVLHVEEGRVGVFGVKPEGRDRVPEHMKYRKRKRLALGMEFAPRPRASSRAPSGSKWTGPSFSAQYSALANAVLGSETCAFCHLCPIYCLHAASLAYLPSPPATPSKVIPTLEAECFVLQPVPEHMKYRKRKRLALGMEIAPRPRASSRAPSGSKVLKGGGSNGAQVAESAGLGPQVSVGQNGG